MAGSQRQNRRSDPPKGSYGGVLDRLIGLGIRQPDGWRDYADFAANKANVHERTLRDYRSNRQRPWERHHNAIKTALSACAACRNQLAELDQAYRGGDQRQSLDTPLLRLILDQDEDRSELPNRAFASAYLIASSQDAHAREADGVLRARLAAFINEDGTGSYRLASAHFQMRLPAGSNAKKILGLSGREKCEDRVTIRHCGYSPRLLAWEIEPEQANSLEKRNVLTEAPLYLTEIEGLSVGQEIQSQLFAAPKDFKLAAPPPVTVSSELAPEKTKIIEALRLNAEFQRKADDGTVVLASLIDVVREARK